jgi:hypothetical protein
MAEIEPEMELTGVGTTLTLVADSEQRMRPGEELAVRLPMVGEGEGWSYEVEGDDRALEIHERAEVVALSGEHTPAPGAAGTSQFLLRALRKGKAKVRFEHDDPAAGRQRLQLRIKVG